jgi:hypothetical protein
MLIKSMAPKKGRAKQKVTFGPHGETCCSAATTGILEAVEALARTPLTRRRFGATFPLFPR